MRAFIRSINKRIKELGAIEQKARECCPELVCDINIVLMRLIEVVEAMERIEGLMGNPWAVELIKLEELKRIEEVW
ncbi:MAG: hypothetical protein ACTSSA_12085 [Candidatus Freyarchaeota archaeon]